MRFPLRSGRCLFCLRDRWLGKREERKAALSPSPAARKWSGGQQVQQLPREERDQFAPPAAAASGHPSPTLGKASIATPYSASSSTTTTTPPYSCPLEG